MLKVLLDARKLGDGGIGTYLNNLISGLLRNPEINLSIIVAKNKKNKFFSEEQVRQIEDASRPYSLDELLFFGKRLSKLEKIEKYDLFHEPHFTLPVQLSIPSVVTIHDIIHISNPEHWYYPHIARFLIRRALAKAREVIVVSDATRTALIATFPRLFSQTQKINVIPNAIAENLLSEPRDWRQLIESNFALKPGYLFALFSMIKPHKGFSDLIEAYKRAREVKQLPELIIAGKGLASITSQNNGLLDSLNSSSIRLIGEVTDQQLASLYKGARATILPSLVEGFGLSALEAKVLGSPLIARPLPSLKAILSSDDIVCSDLSVSALANAIASLEDRLSPWQERVRNASLASSFSVDSVARQTVEIYKQAILSR